MRKASLINRLRSHSKGFILPHCKMHLNFHAKISISIYYVYLFSQFFMKYVLFYEKACNLVRWLKIFQLLLLEDIITPFSYSLCATGHYCPLVKYRLIIDSWPKDTRHTAQRPDATRTKQLISDHNSYTKWTFSYETPFKYEQSRTFLPKKTSIPSSQPSTGTGLWKWVKN